MSFIVVRCSYILYPFDQNRVLVKCVRSQWSGGVQTYSCKQSGELSNENFNKIQRYKCFESNNIYLLWLALTISSPHHTITTHTTSITTIIIIITLTVCVECVCGAPFPPPHPIPTTDVRSSHTITMSSKLPDWVRWTHHKGAFFIIEVKLRFV